MATWNSRGLRGSALEEFINLTNEKYADHGLALIQKVPTPITPINIDKENHHITLAYFDQKSTVDYIGAVQLFFKHFHKLYLMGMNILKGKRIGMTFLGDKHINVYMLRTVCLN